VRESLPELARELESPDLLDFFQPASGRANGDRKVELNVDLDGIEELGDVGELLITLRFRSGINDPLSVFIGPACGSDANHP
jgi:hypothetical protein